jgi:DNA end-binding protein Ku
MDGKSLERWQAELLTSAGCAGGWAAPVPGHRKYRDSYADKLMELIEAKVEGKEIVAPPEEETANVVNLMEALRKSVEQVASQREPVKRAAKSVAPKPQSRRKKRSS